MSCVFIVIFTHGMEMGTIVWILRYSSQNTDGVITYVNAWRGKSSLVIYRMETLSLPKTNNDNIMIAPPVLQLALRNKYEVNLHGFSAF